MDKDTLKFPSSKQDRRRRYDPAWKQRLVEACSEPGFRYHGWFLEYLAELTNQSKDKLCHNLVLVQLRH